jgi:16S rRNA G966 N2-methylase RsmD
MRFPVGKNLRQTLSRIINQIPPHGAYVELFAGSAAVLRHKRPARLSIAVDLSPGAIDALAGKVPAVVSCQLSVVSGHLQWAADEGPGTLLIHGDAIEFVRRLVSNPQSPIPNAFIYADPPYLETSCSTRPRYEHVLTAAQHAELLDLLGKLTCPVAVSGYFSELYAAKLARWRSIHWPEITRGGFSRDQWLWMNYPEPAELHDYRFLGQNYRERENLARQKRRWIERLRRMPRLKRLMLMEALLAAVPGGSGGNGDARSITAGNAGVGRRRSPRAGV